MESTLIYRLSDGLPLAGSSDDNSTPQLLAMKKKVKLLITKLSQQYTAAANQGVATNETIASTSEESGGCIHYLIKEGAAYVCITPTKFPKKLAYSYLSEIANEFGHIYGAELSRPDLKPYQFMQFDSFLSKTKKVYSDSRVQSNMDKLNADLSDVKMIMNKNIEDMLYRGDSLDKLQDLSQSLRAESKKYRRYAEKINFDLLIKQYAPVAVVSLVILFLIYWMIF